MDNKNNNTNNKPLCLLSAPIFNRSGYGGWSTDIARSLFKYNKFNLKIAVQRWGHCQHKRFFDDFDKDDKQIYDCILKDNLNVKPDVFIQVTVPDEFNPIGKYNIGITAGIETTNVDTPFLEGVNRMDLIIALSNHAKNTLINSVGTKHNKETNKTEYIKVNKPIEICFWGADIDVYKKTNEPNEAVNNVINKIKEDFAFLFVGQYTHNVTGLYNDRKDIGNLIRVFCKTFYNTTHNKPCLILKSSSINFSNISRFELLNTINTIRTSVGPNSPNVYLLHGELTDVELNALFNHSKIKCHVSFTHGEGFGHPMLLQTLSGKPLLASNWSGHLDFLNPQYANLLQGTVGKIKKEAVNKYYPPNSEWFTVSYNLAEERLRNIHMNYENKKLHKKAELLRQENKKKFSLDNMDSVLWDILNKNIPDSILNKKPTPTYSNFNMPPLNT